MGSDGSLLLVHMFRKNFRNKQAVIIRNKSLILETCNIMEITQFGRYKAEVKLMTM